VTKVRFYLASGPHPRTAIGTGSLTRFGWATNWNTTSVPNGPYRLSAVIYASDGAHGDSRPEAITVRNHLR
jgi:hypothetical protein